MRAIPVLCLLLASVASHAETPQQIGQNYAAEAAARQAGFAPSAKRGETLFRQRFAHNDKMPACTSCHTDSPLNAGQHAVTGKAIRPLAVAANGERFSGPGQGGKMVRPQLQGSRRPRLHAGRESRFRGLHERGALR